jgi:hypothetical protein
MTYEMKPGDDVALRATVLEVFEPVGGVSVPRVVLDLGEGKEDWEFVLPSSSAGKGFGLTRSAVVARPERVVSPVANRLEEQIRLYETDAREADEDFMKAPSDSVEEDVALERKHVLLCVVEDLKRILEGP